MKKLSLKKTTLSRLNNELLSNVKGGDDLSYKISTDPKDCLIGETGRCMTGSECPSIAALCPSEPIKSLLC